MYYKYFKREFDKKHGNCGVLARFVLFLAGIEGRTRRFIAVVRQFAVKANFCRGYPAFAGNGSP